MRPLKKVMTSIVLITDIFPSDLMEIWEIAQFPLNSSQRRTRGNPSNIKEMTYLREKNVFGLQHKKKTNYQVKKGCV